MRTWAMQAILILASLMIALLCPLRFRGEARYSHDTLDERAEPETGECLPDTPKHPNQLDKVETAFSDALLLASVAHDYIDGDDTIFPNYFNEADRENVKRVYATILGPVTEPGASPVGNDLLGLMLVQVTDTNKDCKNGALAYTNDEDPNEPYIVLCPNAFNKKAISSLKGAESPDENRFHAAQYVRCETLEANGGRVSYRMNCLGATLLHEYMHFDKMMEPIFATPIIDQPDEIGYGPYKVYDNLDRDLARLNADSYTYYALQVFWTEACHQDFLPPRANVDDDDPDCREKACKNRRKRKRNC
ncbi:MAG: hypothetical protein Q9186_005587 [Xanthomendoza sp. 1 TL-2023]